MISLEENNDFKFYLLTTGRGLVFIHLGIWSYCQVVKLRATEMSGIKLTSFTTNVNVSLITRSEHY